VFGWGIDGGPPLRLLFLDPLGMAVHELTDRFLGRFEGSANNQGTIILDDQGQSPSFAANELIDLNRHCYVLFSAVH
jgi:hypothetical protein